GEAGENVLKAAAEAEPAAGHEPEAEPQQEDGRPAEQEQWPVVSTGGRIKASPLARRIARERGIELSSLRGTGPDGRIVAEDVERAQAGAPAPAAVSAAAAAPPGEVESRPLSNIRKTIARRLTQAWTVPAFQLTVDVDMTRAQELVTKQRELNPNVRITVTDVLTRSARWRSCGT